MSKSKHIEITTIFILFFAFHVFAQDFNDKGKLNKNGNKTGKWIAFNYTENDTLKFKSERKYCDGILQGKFIDYKLIKNNSIIVREGRFKNGKLNGKIKIYDTNGKLTSVAIFKQGQITSERHINYY